MRGTSITKEDVKANYGLFLLVGMFVIGMIYGVLLTKSSSETLSNTIGVITAEYTAKLTQQTIFQSFMSSFLSTIVFVLLPYLFGYSAVGQPLIVLIPWFKGLGLGFFMANLYVTQGVSGVLFCALVVLPSTLIALFCILIASREGLKLSNLFFQSFTGKQHIVVCPTTIKLYNVKLLVLLCISLIAAAVNVVAVLLFSRMFQFI